MLAAPQPRLVSITRNLDLHHDEPVVSRDDNALFGSGQLMSNRDSEQVASVVIDTILFFPTHQDVAHAVRRATFTASRSQLVVVRHGTSVRPSFQHATGGAITATTARFARRPRRRSRSCVSCRCGGSLRVPPIETGTGSQTTSRYPHDTRLRAVRLAYGSPWYAQHLQAGL
jgi:hypothetical protein